MFSSQSLQTQTTAPTRKTSNSRYEVTVARTAHEVEEAQRLRYQVFFDEMGATAARGAETRNNDERDCDQFDADCDHLLVRDVASGIVVGSYRILRPEMARRRGAYYSDSEFDLSRLTHIRNSTAEVGRACIHPDFRSGSVIMLLWSGLAKYMQQNNIAYVIGCASIPLQDGHENAIQVYQHVAKQFLAPVENRVFPKNPYPLGNSELALVESNSATPYALPTALTSIAPRIPALIKGYTRLGAWIGGAPAWDPDFNTADIFILLPLSRMTNAYAKHFLCDANAA
jgi:putative hemolysin